MTHGLFLLSTMTPRPQQIMSERRHQDIRSNMSDSLSASVATVAAKPKDETLYESLLRYHEDNDDDGETVSTKSKCDEEDDRKLPAKPTQFSHRSTSYPSRPFLHFHQGSHADESLRLAELVGNRGESPQFPTQEHEVAFAKASLYPDLSSLHQNSLDERFESNTPRPPSELRHQHARPNSLSPMPDEYPPAPHVESAVHDDSLHSGSSFQKMTSFYKSALEASEQQHSSLLVNELIAVDEDEKLARDLAREIDESLARELARKLELEDSLPDSQITDPGQLKIMQEIRKEAERKEIEQALHDNGSRVDFDSRTFVAAPLGTTAPPQVDYLLSQQLAMEEYQHLRRSPPMRRSRSLAGERREQQQPQRVSFEHYQPHSSDESEPHPSPEENRLLQQGNRETREAIANGTAHVVQCRGCLGRLHAPMSYALVFCPKCHTVSPGETYVARDDRASLRRERSQRF